MWGSLSQCGPRGTPDLTPCGITRLGLCVATHRDLIVRLPRFRQAQEQHRACGMLQVLQATSPTTMAIPACTTPEDKRQTRHHTAVLFIIYCFYFFTLLLSSFWTSHGHRCRPSLFSPGGRLQFIGFSNPTARRFFIE